MMDHRNLYGYGEHPPHAQWPGGARGAVQAHREAHLVFVIRRRGTNVPVDDDARIGPDRGIG